MPEPDEKGQGPRTLDVILDETPGVDWKQVSRLAIADRVQLMEVLKHVADALEATDEATITRTAYLLGRLSNDHPEAEDLTREAMKFIVAVKKSREIIGGRGDAPCAV